MVSIPRPCAFLPAQSTPTSSPTFGAGPLASNTPTTGTLLVESVGHPVVLLVLAEDAVYHRRLLELKFSRSVPFTSGNRFRILPPPSSIRACPPLLLATDGLATPQPMIAVLVIGSIS